MSLWQCEQDLEGYRHEPRMSDRSRCQARESAPDGVARSPSQAAHIHSSV